MGPDCIAVYSILQGFGILFCVGWEAIGGFAIGGF